MKKSIGFVGIGQCGGNITSLFEEGGYKTFYINTSLEDLSTLSLSNENYYYIQEANGSNHNRSKAINYIKDHYENIINQIRDQFKEQDIVYLVFSAGGGTGSGISPLLLDMLSTNYKDKVFGAICALPDINEALNVQVNAYNCMVQISNINKLGSVFVLDNSKNSNKELVNTEFYKCFDSVINIPKNTSKKGNIDIAEIKEVLSVRGLATISKFSSDTTSIVKSLEQGCFAYQKDKNVVYMALSLNGDIDMSSLINHIGNPYDVFINYNTDQNICCLSGMSFPKDRINTIKAIIENQKEEIESTIENSKNNSIKNELSWDIQLKNNNKSLEFNQIFSKYQ